MKKIFLLFSCFIFFSHVFSQQSKLNFGAALAASNSTEKEKMIPLFVQGTISEIRKSVAELGGEFRFSSGNIASITLPKKNISILAEKSFVKRIEAKNPFSKIKMMNDSMLANNRIVAVHNGVAPLPQGYNGNGVVLGFIDTGIDYTHPDFQDSTGKTRIKFLWDQTLSDSASPQPYNYGQEWTGADIDNGKATAHIDYTNGDHGTHVVSVEAGNGLSIHKYAGAAPNADIIFVALDFNNANGITDAADYIYNKALQLGEPCVINASVGDYYGSHDGLDLQAQTIKSLVTAQGGRSFVAAAGNYGSHYLHLGYTTSNTDTNFTWFTNGAYIGIYADTNDFKNVHFAIGADQDTPYYSFRGNTSFSTIAPHVGVLENDTIWNGSNRICTMQSYGDLVGGVYSMEFSISPDSAYKWRLMMTGTGKFDEYSLDVDTANLADTTIYPALKKYKQPDLNQNMVSSFQCLDEVITVGNYINRNQYIDYDTLLYKDTTLVPGSLFYASSHGPTRDGKIKPDIAASGQITMACITLFLRDYAITNVSYMLAEGGYHIRDGGTSNASPIVAGIAGLYLQKNPNANWQEIKNAIIYCSRTDSFTGTNLPNNYWGYGKADAFAALTSCNTSVNSNQTTDYDELEIYPNPASNEFTIYSFQSEMKEITIYNLLGKIVFQKPVKTKQETINLNESDGIYFATIKTDKGNITKKILISR